MAAPQFTVNAQRFDPYKNFKFRIKWDGKYVAGMSKGQRAEALDEIVTQSPRRRSFDLTFDPEYLEIRTDYS